ncbi:MAG TPA: hypothetical protein VIR38_02115 [Thalassobaculum sp.]
MNIRSRLDNVELRWVKAAVAAASNTDSNSVRIDMSDYESAVFIVPITDSVATGVATLKVEGNDADSDSGMTAVTGATATVTCAVNDDVNNTLLAVEVRNPGYQYLQGVITSATANIAFGEMTVMLKPRNVPVTQGDTVSDSVTVSD